MRRRAARRLSSASSDEEWRSVIGWEGIYEVSSEGRVRSLDRVSTLRDGREIFYPGRYLKPGVNNGGHLYVRLNRPGDKNVHRYVHRLVMQSFAGDCPEEKEVCHNDGKPDNNRLENLRYDTRSENRLDTVRHGTHHQSKKEKCVRGHLLVAPNLKGNLAEKGQRGCRACNIAQSRCWHKKSKYGIILDVKEESDSAYKKIMEGTNNDK